MQDAQWARGWAELIVAYPQREEASEQGALRAALYRKHLDDLAPDAWLFGVEQVIRTETWFPTVAHLRACADAWRPPVLPALPMSEEEREDARAAARAGLAMLQAAFDAGAVGPVRAMPEVRPEVVVEASEDRIALLKRQAEEIQAAPAAVEV